MLREFNLSPLALLVLTLAAPVAFAATPARDTCALAGRPPWHMAKSTHFVVRTSLDAKAAREATVNLERFLAALLPIWGPQFNLEGPLEVLLVRDSELAPFVQGEVRGFLTHGDDESQLLVISLSPLELTGSPLTLQSMTHQLAHALIHQIFPSPPRWFSEGLATYLETLQVSADNREAVEGYPQMGHLRYVKAHGVLDMEALWRWDEERSLHDAVKLQHQYASAWMWVYYLLKRHPERLERFQLALSRLEEPRQAWEQAFGPVTDLEEGLKAQVSAPRYDAASYAPREVPPQVQVWELPHPEVHVARARLWSKAPHGASSQRERLERVRPELGQAMREDAANDSATMRGVLAQALLSGGQCEQGLLHLRRALVLARDRPDAQEIMASLASGLARYEEACAKARAAAAALPDRGL